MPEGLEAEIWRRSLDVLTGRTITRVWVDERSADPGLNVVLPGATITAIDRRGKIVRLHTSDHVVGLHFGMTGRVIVDGMAPIDSLEYASKQDRPAWDRLRIFTVRDDLPALRVNDPRRLGRYSLDADLDHLGVDIFDIDTVRLEAALVGRRAAIKTVLLDQGVVAGLGNLCADEVLWWAGVAPHRAVDTLSDVEVHSISVAIAERLPIMLRAGGSTAGELDPDTRRSPSACPRDGRAMERSTIGGRTAVWCAHHQQ